MPIILLAQGKAISCVCSFLCLLHLLKKTADLTKFYIKLMKAGAASTSHS